MNRIFFALSLSIIFFNSASAAVISRDWKTPGDGLLTYDDVNQREWLDLTETQLFKFPGSTLEERYQSVLAETAPGGIFESFTVVTRNDVFALAESAGIDTTTFDHTTNRIPAVDLILLVGATRQNGFISTSEGVATDFDPAGSLVAVFSAAAGRSTPGQAGINVTSYSYDLAGVWLYRNVPEPFSAMIFASFFFLLMVRRPTGPSFKVH